MKWIYRIIFLSTLAILAWHSLAWRSAGIGPSDFIDSNPLQEPISWYLFPLAHPDTWLKLSTKALAQGDEKKAYQSALFAFLHDPGNGRAAIQMMHILKRQSKDIEARELAELATNLWQADSYTHAQLANFWLDQNQPGRVISEWSQLIIRNPSKYQRELFPIFKQLLETQEGFTLLTPYMLDPPSWWNAFFNYLVAQNTETELITTIYQQRLQSQVPVNEVERRALTRYLLKGKQYAQAYFLWLSGLDEANLKLNRIIHDGGFEGKIYNSGFDWQYRNQNGVKFMVASTTGAKGHKAINLKLNTQNLNFQHLSQLLQMSSGSYTLSFKYRVDRLQTDGGLSWRVRCLENNQIVAESPSLSNRSPWSTVSVPFDIPSENCSTQILRLEASSQYAHRRNFKGSLWFDQVEISRKTTP
ncbi:MAG TPA: hypothetical protein PLB10_16485 [Thiolinea sp.]|nr:hypothetical protein [Thiolinea sp.]